MDQKLIEDGVDGLLVDPENVEEIAGAIIYLLTNRESAEMIGKKGAEKVRQKFNISNIADQHLELYTSLVQLK